MRRPALQPAAVLAAAVLLTACGDDEPTATDGSASPTGRDADTGSESGQQGFDATLEPLNDSGVEGRAIVSQLGSRLRVQVTASGLVPREEHVQHVHRLETGEAGACPTGAADEDGDGVVDLEESLPAYGPVGLELTPFPRAKRDGSIGFQGTFDIDPELQPLTNRVIVVYGLEVDGVYDPTVPVACGRIR